MITAKPESKSKQIPLVGSRHALESAVPGLLGFFVFPIIRPVRLFDCLPRHLRARFQAPVGRRQVCSHRFGVVHFGPTFYQLVRFAGKISDAAIFEEFEHHPPMILQLPSSWRHAVPYADSVLFPISVFTVNSRHCRFDKDGLSVDDGTTVYRWPVVKFVQLARRLCCSEYAIRP